MLEAKVIRKQIKRYPEKLKQVNRRFLPTAGDIVVAEAKRRAPVNNGPLRASIKKDVKIDSVYVGSNLDYAPHVEYGTRPHFPPVAAIADWAGKVLGDESAAWPIALSISKKGTKEQAFLRPALDKNRKNLVRLWLNNFRSVYGG